MDRGIGKFFSELSSKDDAKRYKALQAVLKAAEREVDWIYEVWDDLVARLGHENSYQRSIAAMVLCSLAKSDTDRRMRKALPALLKLTDDEKFVTARQCIQGIWKIGAADGELRKRVIDHLRERYDDVNGKHYNLVRLDILQSLRMLHDEAPDPALKELAAALIGKEKDPKYQKRYRSAWNGA